MSEKHIFSLYIDPAFLSHQAFTPGQHIAIKNADLWRRIYSVLRLHAGEEIELFNNHYVLKALLQDSNKRDEICCQLASFSQTVPLQPRINLYQAILKREAFEDVIECASQIGATTITPLISEKIHRNWISDKDSARLHKIMVASCEQAKSHFLPEMKSPETFSSFLERAANKSNDELFVGCEHGGQPLISCAHAIDTKKPSIINLLIGPEGGFTETEITQLQQTGITFYQLTPTILRAPQAALLMLGFIRSVT